MMILTFCTSPFMCMKVVISILPATMAITCTAVLALELGSESTQPLPLNWLINNRNINIPWPCKGMGDADYLYAFQNIVMPIAFDFNPDLVIGK